MILFFYVPSRTSSTESAIPSIVKKKWLIYEIGQ
jgi:hypothetical protein